MKTHQQDLDKVREFFKHRADAANANREAEIDPLLFDKQAERIFSALLKYTACLEAIDRGETKPKAFKNNLSFWESLDLSKTDETSSGDFLLPLTPFELMGIYKGIVEADDTYPLPSDPASFQSLLIALWVFYQCLPPLAFLNDDYQRINDLTSDALTSASTIVGKLPDLLKRVDDRSNGHLGGAKSAKVRNEKAKLRHDTWQTEAEKIWKKHPTWGKDLVGEKVGEKTGDNPDTIRRSIKKPPL